MLHITLFRDSQVSFLRALDEAGVSYECDATAPPSLPSRTEIDVVRTLANLERLAEVITNWRAEQSGRLVMLALNDESVTEAARFSATDLLDEFPRVASVSIVEVPASH